MQLVAKYDKRSRGTETAELFYSFVQLRYQWVEKGT